MTVNKVNYLLVFSPENAVRFQITKRIRVLIVVCTYNGDKCLNNVYFEKSTVVMNSIKHQNVCMIQGYLFFFLLEIDRLKMFRIENCRLPPFCYRTWYYFEKNSFSRTLLRLTDMLIRYRDNNYFLTITYRQLGRKLS